MSQESYTSRVDRLLYRFRTLLVATALLLILYCVTYLWFLIPYEDFSYSWRPDSRLIVIDVPADSLAAPMLQPGDWVLEIGGRPVRRMRPLYSLPVQTTYEFKILRDGEIKTTTVPFSSRVTPLAVEFRLPATVLSLAGWLVGAFMLFLAGSDNWQALRAGSIFLFAAMVAIGIQSSLNNVPGSWMIGYALLFFMCPAWAYLGFLPRTGLLDFRARMVFKFLFAVAGGLALVATFEVLALYPQPTSMEEQVGLSLYSLGFLLAGMGLLTSITILATRYFRMLSSSYLRRQIAILLVFIGLGTLPIVLLTILPAVMFDAPLLPFPIAISLMLLIPAGYLFVIYRPGFLGLDLYFSRTIHLILLSAIVFGFYTAALYLIQSLLNTDGVGAIVPASLVFFPTLLFTIIVNKPILSLIERLVYGDVALSQNALAEFATALSSRPETSTLAVIVTSLANLMSCGQAVLVLKDEGGRPRLIGTVGKVTAPDIGLADLHKFTQPILRSAEHDSQTTATLKREFPWAEILIPLRVRDEQLGLLALSRPGSDGYFNTRQVSFLTQAAGVLAVGTENIFLFNTARRQAREMMFVQEEERKNLSRQLHDDPLQQVTYAISVLDQILVGRVLDGNGWGVSVDQEAEARLNAAAHHLRQAASSLRDVCIGLYPPFRDQGVDLAVREIVRQFVEEHGISVEIAIAADGTAAAISEEVTVAVGRVLIEALNNVVKHAPTADVRVTLRCSREEGLALEVADSGPGSPVLGLTYSELICRGHLGIVGMHEWARQVGGGLEIRPNRPNGTQVLFYSPTA